MKSQETADERNLEKNLENFVERMKNGSYQPHPSRRVYIPKDGNGKMRPLGISCYEDKLVETAIELILLQVYEPKFYDESYGFRPGRSCHMAIRKAVENIQYHRTSYVVEADIRSFFDTVDHEWLMKMLEHDIADRKFLEIIRIFLKAGVMEKEKFLESDRGTPQGNGASPVLANIYLHYVLDNWFDVIVKRQCKGETCLIRYADDFICTFQYKRGAEIFRQKLEERFRKYGLELAEEKTKVIQFGRFAEGDRKKKGLGKPETFNFLGFTFYCSMDSKGRFFRCKVRTSRKRLRVKIRTMREWIKCNRNMPLKQLFEKVNMKLRGHYQYYGVTDNYVEMLVYRNQTMKQLFYWINRRSDKRSYTWETFNGGLLRTFPLLKPRITVSLIPSK